VVAFALLKMMISFSKSPVWCEVKRIDSYFEADFLTRLAYVHRSAVCQMHLVPRFKNALMIEAPCCLLFIVLIVFCYSFFSIIVIFSLVLYGAID